MRRKAWVLFEEIAAAFERLPEVFDHNDLNAALGRELDRGAARRNLRLMIEDGVLAKEESTSGRPRLLYRKLARAIADAPE